MENNNIELEYIVDWLMTYPDPDIRAKLLHYHSTSKWDYAKASSLSGAINWGFNWSLTDEGHEFWSKIAVESQYIEYKPEINYIEEDGNY